MQDRYTGFLTLIKRKIKNNQAVDQNSVIRARQAGFWLVQSRWQSATSSIPKGFDDGGLIVLPQIASIPVGNQARPLDHQQDDQLLLRVDPHGGPESSAVAEG